MIVLGIDPGMSGAMALVCSRRGLLDVRRVPVVRDPAAGEGARSVNMLDVGKVRATLGDWWREHDLARESVLGVMERIQPFGKGGASTMMSMGRASGVLEACAWHVCQRVEMVRPQRWKKLYALGAEKSKSVETARTLYPEQVPPKLAHDLAEAILIARWGLLEFA